MSEANQSQNLTSKAFDEEINELLLRRYFLKKIYDDLNFDNFRMSLEHRDMCKDNVALEIDDLETEIRTYFSHMTEKDDELG